MGLLQKSFPLDERKRKVLVVVVVVFFTYLTSGRTFSVFPPAGGESPYSANSVDRPIGPSCWGHVMTNSEYEPSSWKFKAWIPTIICKYWRICLLLAGRCCADGHPRGLRQPVHRQRLRHHFCPQHHDQLRSGELPSVHLLESPTVCSWPWLAS